MGRRVSGFADLFNIFNVNAFNVNAVEALVQASGGSFMRPLTIVAPRIFRVGEKFEW